MDKITKEIKQIFNQFDKNKNGYLDKKDLNSITLALENPLSPAELQDLFKQIDKDNSGKISLGEFIDYFMEN